MAIRLALDFALDVAASPAQAGAAVGRFLEEPEEIPKLTRKLMEAWAHEATCETHRQGLQDPRWFFFWPSPLKRQTLMPGLMRDAEMLLEREESQLAAQLAQTAAFDLSGLNRWVLESADLWNRAVKGLAQTDPQGAKALAQDAVAKADFQAFTGEENGSVLKKRAQVFLASCAP